MFFHAVCFNYKVAWQGTQPGGVVSHAESRADLPSDMKMSLGEPRGGACSSRIVAGRRRAAALNALWIAISKGTKQRDEAEARMAAADRWHAFAPVVALRWRFLRGFALPLSPLQPSFYMPNGEGS